MLLLMLTFAQDAEVVEADAPTLVRGAELYRTNCATCHGVEGDGNGPSARYLETLPRDFTSGLFKFRSTTVGTPPSDEDLARTIAVGVPGTSMPAWGNSLDEGEINAVSQYLKTFSDVFETAPGDTLETPARPEDMAAAAAKGAAMFTALCASCHGAEGKGDGPASVGLSDLWGQPITPADFTVGTFKSGTTPEDLFRTVSSGVEGTPMPPWGALPSETRWELVAYVLTFSEGSNGTASTGVHWTPPAFER